MHSSRPSFDARVEIKDVNRQLKVEVFLNRHSSLESNVTQQASRCQAAGSTDKMKHRMRVKVGRRN